MKPFRIQYVGNLFVDKLFDHYTKLVRPNSSPYLALLGNIGHPQSPQTISFLEYCANAWDRVFWVPGPYELTSKTRFTHCNMIDRMRDVCARKNITLLHHGSLQQDTVQILGTTLWTPCVPGRIDSKYSQPEFNEIHKHNGLITAGDIGEWNAEDIGFLQEELLAKPTDDPVVVLTHHLPHPALLSTQSTLHTLKRVGLEVNHLPSLLRKPCRIWLSGAGGCSASALFPGQVFASVNSLYEYPMRSRLVKNPGFDPTAYAELGVSEAFPFYATMYYGPRNTSTKQFML